MTTAWKTVRLKDVADIRVSNVDKKSFASELPVHLCNYMDVYANDYVVAGLPFMAATATQIEIAKFGLRRGDVMITKDSETPDDIGIPSVLVDEVDNLVCGYHLALIRPKAGEVSSIYLAKQLAAAPATRYFGLNASGSTRFGIPVGAIENFELPLPKFNEQSKIAEVLSTVDRAMAQTEALIAKQQRIKTGLMQDLLTRGIDEHGQLRSEATHAFKDSPLGRIPVEWDVAALERVANVSGGKRLPTGHSYSEGKTGYVYLRVLDFFNREIEVDSLVSLEADTFQALQKYEIRDGELCISIAGSLGYVSLLRLQADMRAILTENALRIVPGDGVDADYLCMAMNGLATQSQIEALKGTGGGVPKLALHRVKSLLIAFPKDAVEQKRAVEIISAHAKNASQAEKALQKLRQLKTALMQDLLTGKVRVTPLLQSAKEATA